MMLTGKNIKSNKAKRMGLVDQLVKPLGILICLLYRKQYLFPYPLAFKTVILKYYPVPFNFIVSFCYANMQRKVTKRDLNQVISRFFFFLTNLSVVSMLPSLLAHLLLLIFKHIIYL